MDLLDKIELDDVTDSLQRQMVGCNGWDIINHERLIEKVDGEYVAALKVTVMYLVEPEDGDQFEDIVHFTFRRDIQDPSKLHDSPFC